MKKKNMFFPDNYDYASIHAMDMRSVPTKTRETKKIAIEKSIIEFRIHTFSPARSYSSLARKMSSWLHKIELGKSTITLQKRP